MPTKKEKLSSIVKIVAGVFVALLIFPTFWFIVWIFRKLIIFISSYLPQYISIPLIAIFFFLLIMITAISKANIGGGALKICMKELFKKREYSDESESRDKSNFGGDNSG